MGSNSVSDGKGRPNKIRTAGVEGIVRKLAAEGLAYRDIAKELKRLGHEIAYGAVARFLSEEAGERRDAVRNAVAEQAHADIPLVTKSLRTWVKDIGGLVQETLAGVAKEEDPIEKDKKLNRAAQSVSTLVNAGAKAAKLLHDITLGAEPAAAADVLLKEAQAILDAKRKRDEELEGEPLH